MIYLRCLLLILLLISGGCSPLRSPPQQAGGGVLQGLANVPFRAQQSRDDCGPAALASLLAHRGLELSVAEITRAVYSPALGGSLLPDLENFARQRGFATRSGRGDLALLRRTLASGRPLIIPVETGLGPLTRPHYLVLYGADAEGFLAHAGVRAAVYITAADLLPRWEKLNRLYLHLE